MLLTCWTSFLYIAAIDEQWALTCPGTSLANNQLLCVRKAPASVGPAAGGGTGGGGGGGSSAKGGRSSTPNWAAAQLAAAREDEELRARREAQDIDIPTTIPLFKCASACLWSLGV